MKKKEKRMILMLIIISAIIIAIVYNVTHKKEKTEVENTTTNENIPISNQEDLVPEEVIEDYVEVQEDGTKVNNSDKLNETKVVDGLEISNIHFTANGGQTSLIADVKNNSGKEIGVTSVSIILYDKEGTELVTLAGVINAMKAGETTQLETITTLDFSNAYDFKVEINQ